MLKSSYCSGKNEAGCDEAGRGCLAGPVFAAAVILPNDYINNKLNDSKLLSESSRVRQRAEVEKNAIAWSVSYVDNTEIDRLNILNASIEAMHQAIAGLAIQPELLLVDGNRFKPFREIPYYCIIKGDGQYMAIAAASILAKTYRDEYMKQQALLYPEYGWERNKGYPTIQHRKAIAKYGTTPLHRMTFAMQLRFW